MFQPTVKLISGGFTWFCCAPVGVCDLTLGVALPYPLILSSVVNILKSEPEELRLCTDLFPKQTIDKGLFKPETDKHYFNLYHYDLTLTLYLYWPLLTHLSNSVNFREFTFSIRPTDLLIDVIDIKLISHTL